MNQQRFFFRLGLFAMGAIVLVIVGVLFLGRGTWFRPTVLAETYFDQSVSGLTVGAPVRHRGVDVGRVTKISFVTSKYQVAQKTMETKPHSQYSMANLILVEMKIDREAVRPLGAANTIPEEGAAAMVKDGLRLRLVTSLLGGGGYLDADFTSDPSRYPPPQISWTPTCIYIPSEPTSASRLIESIDHIAGDVERAQPGQLIHDIDAMVVDFTRISHGVDSAKLQDQVVNLLADLRRSTASLQKILDDPHIAELLSNASGAAGNIRTLTDPEKSNVSHLIADLRKTTNDLSSLLEQPALAQAIANAGPITTDMRRAMARVGELIAAEQQDVQEIIRSFRNSAQNVDALTNDAKDNPSRILFGQPPPTLPHDKTQVPK